MGGKSPDHQLREPSGTDHKTRTNDEHIHEQDKQLLHTQRGKLAIPEEGENPALKALKGKKSDRQVKG
jgi:hypothetical protein